MSKEEKTPQTEKENEQPCENDEKTEENTKEKEPETEETPKDEPKAEDIEKIKKELEDSRNSYLRLFAEYDNYRKRTTKEKAQIYNDATCNAVESILPVLDNFDLALKTPCEDEKFLKGVQMIQTQFVKILTDMGVEEVGGVGEKFDPNIHHAIKQVESEEYEADTVAEVFQKGYFLNDKLIRPAMVAVVA